MNNKLLTIVLLTLLVVLNSCSTTTKVISTEKREIDYMLIPSLYQSVEIPQNLTEMIIYAIQLFEQQDYERAGVEFYQAGRELDDRCDLKKIVLVYQVKSLILSRKIDEAKNTFIKLNKIKGDYQRHIIRDEIEFLQEFLNSLN